MEICDKKGEMRKTQEMSDEIRQWHIYTIVAIVIGPVLAVIVSSLLWSKSPDLTYSFTNSEYSQKDRLVTVKIMNPGSDTSENVNGWVEFPSGETPTYTSGPSDFEVQLGKEWKKLRAVLKMKTKGNRVYFRCGRIQPDIQYTIMFYSANKKGIDFAKNADVYLIDDAGAAKRIALR